VRQHPIATREILSRTGCFTHLAEAAASHHERLDGNGYDLGLGHRDLPMLSRVLCVSDICDALRASRPYRPGMPAERVLEIIGREVGTAVDASCFEALRTVLQADALHRSTATEVPAAKVVPALSEDYRQAA
jgi:HD-GYP domain-containing protein (c-di-GMP phosphodiesterase class II)